MLFFWKQSFAVVNSIILIVLLRPFREPIAKVSRIILHTCIETIF